jgi:uncharacterized protein
MGYPVVHFEINSGAAPELQRFYAEAFGWKIDANNPEGYGDVKTEGVCPGSGFPGIDGGIGPSENGDDFVTFYVQVPDLEAALTKANELGGATIVEPMQAGNVVLAMIRDPRGNRIGLVRAAPA